MLSSKSVHAVKAFGAGRPVVRLVAPTVSQGYRAGGVATKAYLEASVAYAVTQQALAYAAVLGGDAYWERNSRAAPDLKIVGAGVGSTLAAVAIVNTGIGALTAVGMIVGFIGSGGMLAYHVKRTIEADDESVDFPGPKALPATISLISFFALNVFLQGLRAEL